ncbi:calpain-9-like isoform X2 [Haliotis rufescens]|uniref:calpain-9-like isoform X2 n=1 Tax=Haliotis rufescens TaxID=6454 RepID=UPI00201F47C3|nr:calpain-9-like isoform X2 [Haliotis rufescens]
MSQKRTFTEIRDDLVRARSYFVDPEFPPNEKSLYKNGRASRKFGKIVWKRPLDIANNPVFILNEARRHDLDQGYLGNCWFVAGAAILATSHRKQLERVVPRDQGFGNDYAGIFHFYFWWYGEYEEVIIDDYLPTDGYRLIFCHNRERTNEFWSALLEKAYAKLRGSYEALDGGKLQDSLVDFTGGISEAIDIRDKAKIAKNIYEMLYNSFKMNSMIGGSIFRPPNATTPEVRLYNGLYMGHAYSITGFTQLSFKGRVCRLVRLRNPWGRKEWNGSWSDKSREIASVSEEIKNDLRFRARDDGEFWISIEDFLANFDEIQLCHLQPDALTDEVAIDENKNHWNVTLYHDSWIRGVTAGGCGNPPNQNLYWKNPQFFVTLREFDDRLTDNDCTLIVSLMEKEKGGDVSKTAIGFDVYRLNLPDFRPLDGQKAPRNTLLLTKRSGSFQYYREVCRRFELPPGTYVIIPSTFEPHEERNFLLRLFTEKKAESGIMDEDPGPATPVQPVEDTTVDLFAKYSGEDGRMDSKELAGFLKAISKTEFTDALNFSSEACRSLVSMMDQNQTGFVNFEDVKKMWKEVKTYSGVFRKFDADKTGSIDTLELGSLFNALGFPLSRSVLTAMVRRYGGRDNRIIFEDFVIVMSKLLLMYGIFVKHQKGQGNREGVAEFTRNEFLMYTMFC